MIWNLCHPQTYFRLALLCTVLGENVPLWNMLRIITANVGILTGSICFFTYCIWSSLTFITEKQANKCSSLVVLSISLHKFFFFSCLRILHLTCSSKMKRFAECQSKVCFIMAHFSEWCAIPIWNNSGWHMYQNGTQHVHAKQLLDFIKVSVSLRCTCNGIGKTNFYCN